MKRCMWCTETDMLGNKVLSDKGGSWCELRDGIADDDSCNGSEREMWECNYVASTAEFDRREVEDVIEDWLR